MKSNQVFPSRWIKADDLQGKRIRVTIDDVRMEEIGGEDKPVLHFQGKDKGMICNVTNWGRLAVGLGSDESDDWHGRDILLQAEPVSFQGKTVMGLRVHVDQPVANDSDDAVPF